MMLRSMLLLGTLVVAGCGAPDEGARQVPVSNRPDSKPVGPPAATKAPRAIATH